MQSFPPLPQSRVGVRQNLIELKYDAGASAWYSAQEPFCIRSMNGHAFVFPGVSPKYSACCAWTFGVEIHLSHS